MCKCTKFFLLKEIEKESGEAVDQLSQQVQREQQLSQLQQEHQQLQQQHEEDCQRSREVVEYAEVRAREAEAQLHQVQSHWVIPRREIELTEEKLGQGAYGEVFFCFFFVYNSFCILCKGHTIA